MKFNKIDFDREIIQKFQTNAPRYTSYPTADRFNLDFNREEQLKQIKAFIQKDIQTPISLYIHIPFCNTLCLYCACNKVITNDRTNIKKYLSYLETEIKLYYNLIGRKLDVVQLHFGGGSPSWMSLDELDQVMLIINRYFNLDNAYEIAMEIDPRHTGIDFIKNLKKNRFTRISIGLQDFNSKVQKTVNRIQSYEDSKLILDSARELGFNSTNVDLIYGLPFQTVDTFNETLDMVLTMKPERLALFNYAHIPNVFMPQTRIKEEDLPTSSEKLDILQMSVAKLSQSGYQFIGMDHFAVPDDELAKALNNGTLQRNFQGYSTFADTNMLSFGVSSIGMLNNSYYQNIKDLDSYYSSLDNGQLPIFRGVLLDQDDVIRRDVISDIMCKFELDFNLISDKYKIDFKKYFASNLIKLNDLVEIGLVLLNDDLLSVTTKGRFLIRNIAVIFDKYYIQTGNKRYSKVI